MKKLLLLLFTTLLFSSNIYAQQSDDTWIKKVVALYVVYLQRAPDYKGLSYWINEAKTEQNRADILKKLSAKFATYPLFISTYGTLNNQLFVQKMYQYILGKEGNKSGILYWTNLLDTGLKRSEMIIMFINSSLTPILSKENAPNLTEEEIISANLRKQILSNKIELALYFTYSLKELSNIKNLLSVEDDPAYIASQKILFNLYSNPLNKDTSIYLIDNAMSSDNPIAFIINNSSISISGTVTYVRPLLNSNHIGFSSQEKRKPAKEIVVKLLDDEGNILSSTTTNSEGKYSFSYVPQNIDVRVNSYAIMESNESNSSWSVKVVDNTQNDALYTIEGSLANTKESNNQRDINIPLKNLKSAPFSILDDIYSSMKKIIEIKPTAFPPLSIKWSSNNISSDGSLEDGQIGSSFFNGENSIYLLGDQKSDSDEFDTHIIIHEWGHYFEKNFSRADSIGGSHGEGDRLDIRVAFGEGFGNAWSAIVTDNPIYTDASGNRGWFMNIEHDNTVEAGWWSEASVQKIIYDLYDGKNEPHDQVALGLRPIYEVLTNEQKNTKALTSIFSFITALKKRNPTQSSKIDKLLADENIESISDDIYGDSHHNLYSDLGEERVCTSSKNGIHNKLLNHKFIRFSIDFQKSYTIRVEQSNNKEEISDPDFYLYGGEPFKLKSIVESEQKKLETSSIFLTTGDYILDISDYNNLEEACFEISIK